MVCAYYINITIAVTGSDDEYDLLVANGQYIYTVHYQGSENDVVRDEPGERSIGVDVHFGLDTLQFQLCILMVSLSIQKLTDILV